MTKILRALSSAFVCLAAMAASGAELSLVIGGQASLFHGTMRQLSSVELRARPAALLGADVSFHLGERSSLRFGARELRTETYAVENGVRYDGSRLTMRPLFVSYDYRLANAGPWEPRVGLGAGIILMSGNNRLPETPSAPLIAVHRPDHPAVVLSSSLGRTIGSHGLIRFGIQYGPFNSTAEVRRAQYPNDDLRADFHPLAAMLSTGFRF